MESKDKCDVTVQTECNKTNLTEKSCKVRVIKREGDRENERGESRIRCSEVDTCGNGQMEEKNEQERI